VFLRELISNASDSMEKLRHLQATGMEISDPDAEMEITISIDKDAGTLTLSDSGVGLSKDEMVSFLGTIAHSGSKAFVAEAKSRDGASASDKAAAESIIGQFGVGFYSAFMVGTKVEVASKPAAVGVPSHVWSSEGSGSYTVDSITDGKEPSRGCSITIHLKDDQKEYLDPKRLKEVIKKYSNFVNFPIKLEGEVVNTIQAIWTKSPSEVSDEEYLSFYKFQSGSYDDPAYRLHFRADAPLDLKVLLFVPSFHTEKWGGGHMNPGVSLYSRKVLIEKDSPDLLPEWMRFVKGVVDSEDLPLAISREKPQDSRLLKRIQTVLVKRFLKFLNEKAIKEPDAYRTWFAEFGLFLKEGVCRDYSNQADIAKLLYFESSTMEEGKLTSFDEYISRCTPEQDQIFFLCAPNRKLAEESPYFETFKAHNREVRAPLPNR
jgi:TNF receptor-associated protein 1